MSKSETRALIERYYAGFNAGDSEAMAGCLALDVVHDVNQGGERRIGRDRFAAFMARMHHHYDEQLSDVVIFVSDDGTRAAAEYNVTGVYNATEDGLPPARGQSYQLPGGAFFAVANGEITRVTTYYNLTDWITQVMVE
ncbi:MAG: ketosteroid isomerase-related protein [Hyphomicrobiaceae bacterium]